MRHVSRTHRVALDWLFDRINWDPKIHIKCVDTNNQLANTLTKGNSNREERNHLFRLFSIMYISQYAISHCISTTSSRTCDGNDKESHWYKIVSQQHDDIPELRWPS